MNTFYEKDIKSGITELSEEEAKHCLLVLRMKKGDEIRLVDGFGGVYRAILTQADKKRCGFEVLEEFQSPVKSFRTHLAIAPTKNADRMEWMVEKLGEIGCDALTLLSTEHSERTHLRLDRLEKKAVSAMKQSGSAFLMQLHPTTLFETFVQSCQSDEKWIAHVSPEHPFLGALTQPSKSVTLLIGPEGDFSPKELALAIQHGFTPVGLGRQVLRTETAGLLAAHTIYVVNHR